MAQPDTPTPTGTAAGLPTTAGRWPAQSLVATWHPARARRRQSFVAVIGIALGMVVALSAVGGAAMSLATGDDTRPAITGPSATANPGPTATASPSPTATASPRPSATASPGATASPSPSVTASPSPSASPSAGPS